MQIDTGTRFEITLLARAVRIILSLIDPNTSHFVPVCELLFKHQRGEGLSTGFFTSQTEAAERMSLSRLLHDLADEDRIALSGQGRALSAMLTPEREREVLDLVGLPSINEVREVLAALATVKSDGFVMVADDKDSSRDKREDRNQVFWTYLRLAIGVLHGRIEWKPSIQSGFVFVALTAKGREALATPAPQDIETPVDCDEAEELFDRAMLDAANEYASLTRRDSQEIGIVCAPYSFGDLPKKTLCRMLPDRSNEASPTGA
jgi:hypothetical protein